MINVFFNFVVPYNCFFNKINQNILQNYQKQYYELDFLSYKEKLEDGAHERI